jgi:hypothetical protein
MRSLLSWRRQTLTHRRRSLRSINVDIKQNLKDLTDVGAAAVGGWIIVIRPPAVHVLF